MQVNTDIHASTDAALLGVALLLVLWLAWVAWLVRSRRRARAALATTQALLAAQATAHRAELQQTWQQLRQTQAAADTADQAKTRFIAAASHDLRQPAHALGLYMAALRAGPLAPAQAEIAQRMAASLASLEDMFTALLDISRIDAGALLPRWDVVPLAPLLRRLADEWAPAAHARGLRLALRLADGAATTVTDAPLLERLLRNLLSNAVKYTPCGGVLLACRARTAPDGAGHWRIEVWDTGVGISAVEQERVFEEFVRIGGSVDSGGSLGSGPNSGVGLGPGLGLGLAIARRLSQLLQLRLTLHSRPGRGTVFFIEGLSRAGAAPLQAAAARSKSQRLAGTRVAVLDDAADVRDAMARLLALWGCAVQAGSDAAEVLRLQQPAAHAVIADVRLAAGGHGPEEAQALMTAWGRAVPLLLVSGETAADPLLALQDAGHTCWAKPVSPARLRAWLEAAVGMSGDADNAGP